MVQGLSASPGAARIHLPLGTGAGAPHASSYLMNIEIFRKNTNNFLAGTGRDLGPCHPGCMNDATTGFRGPLSHPQWSHLKQSEADGSVARRLRRPQARGAGIVTRLNRNLSVSYRLRRQARPSRPVEASGRVAVHAAVGDAYQARRMSRDVLIVCDHHHGGALGVEFSEQLHDATT